MVNSERKSSRALLVDFLLERDGSVCGICREELAGDYSFDHVVPLARGGEDSVRNIRLAHLRCNLVRGWVRPPRQIEFKFTLFKEDRRRLAREAIAKRWARVKATTQIPASTAPEPVRRCTRDGFIKLLNQVILDPDHRARVLAWSDQHNFLNE